MSDNVILLTPRWSANVMTDTREEPLCQFELDGPDWFLTLRKEMEFDNQATKLAADMLGISYDSQQKGRFN